MMRRLICINRSNEIAYCQVNISIEYDLFRELVPSSGN